MIVPRCLSPHLAQVVAHLLACCLFIDLLVVQGTVRSHHHVVCLALAAIQEASQGTSYDGGHATHKPSSPP